MLLKKDSSFKHPLIAQIMVMVVVAIITSFLAVAQASISRKDAETLINESETRSIKQIDKLDEKQDLILEKLEDLKIRMAIIGERVGVNKDKSK